MLRQIKVADLCNELERKLAELQYSDDSMRRYRKVFREFSEYACDCDYSQSKGTDFLVWKFQRLGGFVTSGEHSKNEMYYFRAVCSLAEYYNFGSLFRRHDFRGEIVWQIPFKEVTENFLRYEIEYGCSHYQYDRCRAVIKDLIHCRRTVCCTPDRRRRRERCAGPLHEFYGRRDGETVR